MMMMRALQMTPKRTLMQTLLPAPTPAFAPAHVVFLALDLGLGRICACAAFIHAVGVTYQVIILILVTTLFFLGLALLLGSPTCAQYLSQTILHFSIAVCKVGLERLFLARTLNLLLTPPAEISAEFILTKDAAF